MKKFFIFFVICLACKTGKTQNLSLDSKLGYAIGETKTSKHIMLFKGTGVAYETDIKYALAFAIGISYASAQFSYTDTLNNSVFEKQYFLQLPASIIKYFSVSMNSNVFFQVGSVFSALPANRKEFFTLTGKRTATTKDWGFNIGLLVNTGYKTKIAKNNWYMSLALSGYQDFFASNKINVQNIKINQTGLSISFIKDLSK